MLIIAENTVKIEFSNDANDALEFYYDNDIFAGEVRNISNKIIDHLYERVVRPHKEEGREVKLTLKAHLLYNEPSSEEASSVWGWKNKECLTVSVRKDFAGESVT
jgi:hypothetical protein